MAIAVIGGLISSTVLSLVFVPAVFALMDDVVAFIWRMFGRFVGPPDEPDEADDAPVAHSAALAAHHGSRGAAASIASRPLAAE